MPQNLDNGNSPASGAVASCVYPEILQEGNRVTLTMTDIQGEEYEKKGTVEKEPVQHGYYPEGRPGTWANSKSEGWRESYCVGFREKGHQKVRGVRVEQIEDARLGWDEG